MRTRSFEILVATVLALLYGCLIFGRFPLPDRAFFGGDSWEYQSTAVNLAAGKGFRLGALLPFEAYRFDNADPEYYERFMQLGAAGGEISTYRAPAYPVVLGVIYKIFGVSPRVAIAIQIGWLLLMCALLPFLGRELFGRGGFVAGLLAGVVFHRMVPNVGGRILTEALIALIIFLVLVAWVSVNRNGRPGLHRSAIFGATLAAAVLVKGSLIFLPPLFLGIMAVGVVRKRYSTKAFVTALAAFALPVAAYSAWASCASGSFVILSTQGPSALLAGHNEFAVESGGWSPQWETDPESYFNRIRQVNPYASPLAMIIAFYADSPARLIKAVPNKLIAMFGTKTSVLLGLFLVYLLAVLACCWVRSQFQQRVVITISLIAILSLSVAAFRVSELQPIIVLTFFGPGLLFFIFGCLNRCFRVHVRALWSSPGWVAVMVIIINFVLVAIVIFGDPRFFAPARFVVLMASALILLRMLGTLIQPGSRSLQLSQSCD